MPRIPFVSNASATRIAVLSVLLGNVIAIFGLNGCARQPHNPGPGPAESASAPESKALSGTYTFFADGRRQTVNGQPREGGQPSTTSWHITSCGTGCASVTSSLGWSVELRLAANTWQATRKLDADLGAGCGPDSSTITYSLNADTLSGTVTNYIPCGNPHSVVVVPATLTKN
jgi:hypothetical protein